MSSRPADAANPAGQVPRVTMPALVCAPARAAAPPLPARHPVRSAIARAAPARYARSTDAPAATMDAPARCIAASAPRLLLIPAVSSAHPLCPSPAPPVRLLLQAHAGA